MFGDVRHKEQWNMLKQDGWWYILSITVTKLSWACSFLGFFRVWKFEDSHRFSSKTTRNSKTETGNCSELRREIWSTYISTWLTPSGGHDHQADHCHHQSDRCRRRRRRSGLHGMRGTEERWRTGKVSRSMILRYFEGQERLKMAFVNFAALHPPWKSLFSGKIWLLKSTPWSPKGIMRRGCL